MSMKKLFSLLLVIALAFGLAAPAMADNGALRIIAPDGWELEVGDGRTLDYVFTNYSLETRMLTWSSDKTDVAAVDEWGRVTAVAPGTATITATQSDSSLADSVTVKVVAAGASASGAPHGSVVNYAGQPAQEVKNLQKLVTRWSAAEAQSDSAVPQPVKDALSGAASIGTNTASEVTSDDGALWEITDYGVLRTIDSAPTERDKEMRFMGNRYFYEDDTTTGKVKAIFADGAKGIWTVMDTGVTHIEMVEMSAAEKASVMSNATQQYVSRRGMVSEANWNGSEWVPQETDNDGLWTAMYGAGELFRYAALRDELAKNPFNSELQRMTAEAKKIATLATEAVLLLANISMRTGETKANVKYFSDSGYADKAAGKWPLYNNDEKDLTSNALIENGDYSVVTPDKSPAEYDFFAEGRKLTVPDGNTSAWASPSASDGNTYAKQTRRLGGFIARTYSLHGEQGGNADSHNGKIYWDLADYTDDNKKALGKSASEGVVNGEDLKDVTVDASGKVPDRLWNDLLGSGVDIEDIVYKGDTSTDEIIGHLFIYKIAYDVFKDSDPELAKIIADTMDGFAQHLSDNEYMLVDATGQPTTWGKMNREYFYTYRWGATNSPLTASVLLCVFKVAAYVTGYEKWEDEYRLLLEDGAYLYGNMMKLHTARDMEFLDNFAGAMLYSTLDDTPLTGFLGAGGLPALSGYSGATALDKELSFLLRSFAQYSDEEMAMLAFYTLFQLEKDAPTLGVYREALEQWWDESIQYSENPLWYYIYQLAHPTDTDIKDAYGNNILETAAWSLSRHPIDTRKWSASNDSRDDIMIFNLKDYSDVLDTRGGLSIVKTTLPTVQIGADGIIAILLSGGITYGQYDLSSMHGPKGDLSVEYAVAAPDERALHKFNNSTYLLNDDNANSMEGSTTYTLPYWMGVYHGMLKLSEFAAVAPPYVPPTEKPTPASELFDDVKLGDWYHDDVTHVVNAGLFNGVAQRRFDPEGLMTRAMLVTVIWRMAGEPAAAAEVPFTDVEAGAWYYDAVAWAVGKGIINGVDDKSFAPELPVTREQAVTILWRYAKSAGMDISVGEDTNILSYKDAQDISEYAVAAFQWACGAGIVNGYEDGTLAPQDNIKRCEAAKIFTVFQS